MACCTYGGNNTAKKNAAIVFRREELLYDITNIAYVMGDAMGEQEQHQRHLLQDIGAPGNVDRVTRILNLAHRECVEILYPFTRGEIPDDIRAGDDRLTEPNNYVIFLAMPATFALSTLELLEPLVHEYMVCRVLADWLDMIGHKAAETWAARLLAAKEALEEATRRRFGRARISLQPSW